MRVYKCDLPSNGTSPTATTGVEEARILLTMTTGVDGEITGVDKESTNVPNGKTPLALIDRGEHSDNQPEYVDEEDFCSSTQSSNTQFTLDFKKIQGSAIGAQIYSNQPYSVNGMSHGGWCRLIVVCTETFVPSGNSHGAGFPRLQHWTTNGINMLAGLCPLIMKKDLIFCFHHDMVGAWSSARPPGRFDLRNLLKIIFLPKNWSTYVETWWRVRLMSVEALVLAEGMEFLPFWETAPWNFLCYSTRFGIVILLVVSENTIEK